MTHTAAELNGSWDTTWFTWAKAGHAQLGPECEVTPGAQQIVPMVRVHSSRAHAPWPNQTKADYPAVASEGRKLVSASLWPFLEFMNDFQEKRKS